jgi:hypothetical protein
VLIRASGVIVFGNSRPWTEFENTQATRRNIRVMVDSISHMCDMDRIRNFAMSEYIVKTPEWER